MGTDPIFLIWRVNGPRPISFLLHASCGALRGCGPASSYRPARDQPQRLLFRAGRLCAVPATAPDVLCRLRLFGARLLPDDESCSPAAHASRIRFLFAAHEEAGPVLCPIRESQARPHRNALGGALSLLHGEFRRLCARLLPLRGAQSGLCRHGAGRVGLPVVQLPCQCAGASRGLVASACCVRSAERGAAPAPRRRPRASCKRSARQRGAATRRAPCGAPRGRPAKAK